jgi:hypothetical protein
MTSAAVAAAVEAQPDLKPNESCRSSAVGCLVIVARHHGMHLTGPQVIRDNFLTRLRLRPTRRGCVFVGGRLFRRSEAEPC